MPACDNHMSNSLTRSEQTDCISSSVPICLERGPGTRPTAPPTVSRRHLRLATENSQHYTPSQPQRPITTGFEHRLEKKSPRPQISPDIRSRKLLWQQTRRKARERLEIGLNRRVPNEVSAHFSSFRSPIMSVVRERLPAKGRPIDPAEEGRSKEFKAERGRICWCKAHLGTGT